MSLEDQLNVLKRKDELHRAIDEASEDACLTLIINEIRQVTIDEKHNVTLGWFFGSRADKANVNWMLDVVKMSLLRNRA